jgi:hypothetical protein
MRNFAQMQRQIPKKYLQQTKLDVEVGRSYAQCPFDFVEKLNTACRALAITTRFFWWAWIQKN